MKTLIIILLVIFSTLSGISQDLSGVWHGLAKSPDDKEILFVFFFENTQNKLVSTMAIPTFDVSGIKPKTSTFIDGKIRIDGSNVGMKYEGMLNPNTGLIEGTYTEGDVLLTLNLKKGNPEMVKLNRPQEPLKPYPYYEEQVVFENTEAGIKLSGTFTRPNEPGMYPVVILISGSGRHDRNESMMTHQPFLVLSDYLTRNNIAVLRYDDRGFGASTGDFDKATTADFAQDVLSAVQYVKSRNDIKPNQIGLIGHSEGGIIAPLAANQTSDVSFIISLAATGIPGREVVVRQAKALRPFPVPDEDIFAENVRKSIEIASSDLEISAKRNALNAHNEAYLSPILRSLGATDENISSIIKKETETALRPWNKYFFNFNPANEFEKLNIPVLSLNGGMDIQVDADINQKEIRKALIIGENTNFKVLELKGLNHLFQECETGEIREYKEIEQTMSPFALKEISEWIFGIIREN